MKMSSAGGKDFLSTKDPVRKDSKRSTDSDDRMAIEKDNRPFVLRDVLKQFYPGSPGR
jgi:hypothetical protein